MEGGAGSIIVVRGAALEKEGALSGRKPSSQTESVRFYPLSYVELSKNSLL